MLLNNFAPSEPTKELLHRRFYLKKGLLFHCLLFSYAQESNIGNQWYIWKVEAEAGDPSDQL